MPRLLIALACFAAFGGAGSFEADADPAPTPTARPALDGADQPVLRGKNAGTIEGDVVAVDYRDGTIAVEAAGRRYEIVVLPSTNIAGHDNFHTIADIAKGTRVQVILSERGGTYIAQIIRLR